MKADQVTMGFGPFRYTRVGQIAVFMLGRYYLYRRIGECVAIGPWTIKKGA